MKKKISKAKKVYVKEEADEDEETKAEEDTETDEEAQTEKAEVTEEDEEDEDKLEKEEDEDEDLTDEEVVEACNKFKEAKKAKKAIAEKSEGISPAEDAAASNQAGGTINPNAKVPSTQDVFVPSSKISVKREVTSGTSQTGQSPSDISYGKSVSPDLMKSPLFVELNKSIDGIRVVMSKKVEAIEKSMNDRLDNLTKSINKLEKFYSNPLYKSIDTDNGVIEKEYSVRDKATYSI